jgi:hypothetical protein
MEPIPVCIEKLCETLLDEAISSANAVDVFCVANTLFGSYKDNLHYFPLCVEYSKIPSIDAFKHEKNSVATAAGVIEFLRLLSIKLGSTPQTALNIILQVICLFGDKVADLDQPYFLFYPHKDHPLIRYYNSRGLEYYNPSSDPVFHINKLRKLKGKRHKTYIYTRDKVVIVKYSDIYDIVVKSNVRHLRALASHFHDHQLLFLFANSWLAPVGHTFKSRGVPCAHLLTTSHVPPVRFLDPDAYSFIDTFDEDDVSYYFLSSIDAHGLKFPIPS